MTKINGTTPPVVHTPSSPTSAPTVKQGSSPPTPSSSTPKSPGQTSQFSAPKPAYSDPYAKGKPPSPQQQAAYTTSTKSVGYGGASKAPQFTFLKQPKTPPDSNLCAFYALHHFTNGQVGRQDFLDKATSHYENLLDMSPADAKALVMDGNDPSVLGLYGLNQSDATSLEHKGIGVIANESKGHFFTVRKEGEKWVSYDSYNHSAPKKYDSFAELKKAEIGGSSIWTG